MKRCICRPNTRPPALWWLRADPGRGACRLSQRAQCGAPTKSSLTSFHGHVEILFKSLNFLPGIAAFGQFAELSRLRRTIRCYVKFSLRPYK